MTLRSLIQSQEVIPAISLPKRRPAFMEILSIRAFRCLWLSNGLTFMGARIQDMAVAWLVLEMTNSKLWVGIVNGLPTVSIILFSLLGGVLADRTDRRVLLLWSRLTLASLTFLGAFLITLGVIELWQLIIIAVLAAGVYAQDMSISRTLVLDIVGKGRLLGATSMNSMVMDVGAIVGPSLAGVLIARTGVDAALFMLAGAYVLAFSSILFIKGNSRSQSGKRTHVLRDLIEGFSYIRRTPQVAWLVSLSATVPLAGIFFSMMPIYARDVLGVGSQGLGILMATYGVGALVGSVALSIRGNISRQGLVVALAALVYAAGMLIFAFSRDFQISLASVFFLGMASTFWKNTTSTMVQTSAVAEMRGRVMSVFGMGVQMLALGWLLGGVLATVFGNQGALVIAGVLMAALNLFVYSRSKNVRYID